MSNTDKMNKTDKMENKTKELLELTVAQLVGELRAHRISSHEVTEAYIKRIDETEPKINAYITRTYDCARDAAEKADRLLAENADEIPLLTGVPLAVKDNIALRGYRMTCASKVLEDFVPPYTASVVEKSGGVVLGKTNLDEFAMGSSCEKSIIGATKNPLDQKRSAGGSSGGAAAAVASHMAPWAIATDTGGSSRQPAAFCGLVSMKPTYGMISRYGVTELASSMDTVCPITENVYDNAMILEAIAGRDPRDMTSIAPLCSFTEKIENGVGGMKIGLMRGMAEHCDHGQTLAVERAAKILEKLGAALDVIDLPDTTSVVNAYVITTAAEVSSNLARYDGLKYGYSGDGESYSEIMADTRCTGLGDEVKRRIIAGAYVLSSTISGDRYRRVQVLRQNLCEQTDELFGKYDVVLMPTAQGIAFKLSDFDNDPTGLYNSDRFTAFANLTGCPAITIPCGGDGVMPYGAMLMGGRLREDLLFRAAFALENELKPYIREEVRRVEL